MLAFEATNPCNEQKSNVKNKSNILLLCACMALSYATSARAQAAVNQAYEAGLSASEDRNDAKAFLNFHTAAQAGDRNAQRTVALMFLYGERLYGVGIHRDREMAKHWFKKAADGGCEISAFMLKKMEGVSTPRA